jgi:hypothetical protein
MESTSLNGVVLRVYRRKTGTSENGKPWSVQRFKLGTDGGKEFNVEVWNEPDLAELKGRTVRCFGSHIEEQYEGKTYEKFRTDGAPQLLNANGNGEGNPADDPAGSHDPWQTHLQRATNLLLWCHRAARKGGLPDTEDARALFREMKNYIKDMPVES